MMIEIYLFKTIIAFISISAINIVFKDSLNYITKNEKPVKHPYLNRVLLSSIPIVRWIMVAMLLIGAFAGYYKMSKESE